MLEELINMVVLDASQLGSSLLGGPYAQGAPALKMIQKRYLGLHQWLGPVCTKELKEQIVSIICKEIRDVNDFAYFRY